MVERRKTGKYRCVVDNKHRPFFVNASTVGKAEKAFIKKVAKGTAINALINLGMKAHCTKR